MPLIRRIRLATTTITALRRDHQSSGRHETAVRLETEVRRNMLLRRYLLILPTCAQVGRIKPLTDTTKLCLAFARQGCCFGLFAVLQASA